MHVWPGACIALEIVCLWFEVAKAIKEGDTLIVKFTVLRRVWESSLNCNMLVLHETFKGSMHICAVVGRLFSSQSLLSSERLL